MKYSDLNLAPIGLNRKCAATYLGGSEVVLDELISDYGLRPRVYSHKLTIFDLRELKEAWHARQRDPYKLP